MLTEVNVSLCDKSTALRGSELAMMVESVANHLNTHWNIAGNFGSHRLTWHFELVLGGPPTYHRGLTSA